jgi:hypothetical protein
MGHMRGTFIWGAALLAIGLSLTAAGVARAQDGGAPAYAPAHPTLPIPIGSTRPEDGGLFVAFEYVMWHQTNTLKDQEVAVRGFTAVDSSFPGVPAGTFIGSANKALDVSQVSGPTSFEPGYKLVGGYKFKDGSALTLSAMYVATFKYQAVATLAPPGLQVGGNFAESFLSAAVFNYPNEFAGPDLKVAGGGPQAAFGIWNAASIMTEQFLQRFYQWDLAYRKPVYDTECYRMSGILGFRKASIWEKYRWQTNDLDLTGTGGPADNAIYTNTVSNNLWGATCGCSQEYYMGHGFSCNVDIGCALFWDSVHEIAKYERADKYNGPERKRAIYQNTIAPEVEARVGLMWYPTEFIQITAGYNGMLFLNTIASPRPIDFNYSSVTPKYENVTRLFDGFDVGIAFLF